MATGIDNAEDGVCATYIHAENVRFAHGFEFIYLIF